MRRVIALATIAFTITLGVVVGSRLSSEAMAVVVGIVCGVLASVPTSILLLVLARRLMAEPPRRAERQRHAYPPVIVVNPNAGHSDRMASPFYDAAEDRPAGYLTRDFRIIGEEEEEENW